jgi:DNA-binding MarR family transcriptional regulator
VPKTNAAWRKQNLGYRLFAANDRFMRDKMARVQADGFVGITNALLSLLLNLDEGGTRVSDIAARAGLTKQSMVELIDRAEKLGAVLRDADPDDKRARIVRFTPLGTELCRCLHQAIIGAEQRFANITGAAFAAQFKHRFGAYSAVPVGDGGVVGEISSGRAEPSWRSGNVGRVLALASRRFARDALNHVHQHNYREVTEVTLALFRNLDLEGTRLTEIAARAHMTKQSMRELVNGAEMLGFVERQGDPADRRAKIIAFTDAGLAMLAQMRIGLAEAEAAAGGSVGEVFLAETRRRLLDYAAINF